MEDNNFFAWFKTCSISFLNDCRRSFSREKRLKSSTLLDYSMISCNLCLIETQNIQITTSHVLQYAEHLYCGCASQKQDLSSSLLPISTTSWPNSDLTRRWHGIQESQRLILHRRQKKETGVRHKLQFTTSWHGVVSCEAIIWKNMTCKDLKAEFVFFQWKQFVV